MCYNNYSESESRHTTKTKNERKRGKRKMEKKYLVEFEWTNENIVPEEDEFFPVIIYRLNELAEMLEEYFRCLEFDECPYEIVNIRLATEEEIEKYPHYYC